MSILSILPKVVDYNRDKPNSFSSTVKRELTTEDNRKIKEIINALIKLNPPYHFNVVVIDRSKQLYIRCIEKKKHEQKTRLFPNINKYGVKV